MKTALLILCAASLYGQRVQQNWQKLGESQIYVISMNWLAGSDGSVPVTPAVLPTGGLAQGYRVLSVEAAPGTTAPTNGYSLTLPDSLNMDLLGGGGVSLSSTIAQYFTGLNAPPPLNGTFSLSITGNSVAAAQGKVLIYLAPITQVLINAAPGPVGPLGRLVPQAYATLTACSAAIEGTLGAVNDSNTITWGATVAGSSTNHVLAYCDGTNWTVAGK